VQFFLNLARQSGAVPKSEEVDFQGVPERKETTCGGKNHLIKPGMRVALYVSDYEYSAYTISAATNHTA
jgi:hypothetical protein